MSAFLASIFYFKCHAAHYTLPTDDYVKPNGTRLTRHSSDQDVLPIPKCHTKLFQFSYFKRIAKLWSTLPESTRTLTSLNQFKSHVFQSYSAAFRTTYDVTNFNIWIFADRIGFPMTRSTSCLIKK